MFNFSLIRGLLILGLSFKSGFLASFMLSRWSPWYPAEFLKILYVKCASVRLGGGLRGVLGQQFILKQPTLSLLAYGAVFAAPCGSLLGGV